MGYLRLSFKLSSKKIIHKRQTYSYLDFLGDAGGMYESVFIIGGFLNLLISANSQSFLLLRSHFQVATKPYQRRREAEWLTKQKRFVPTFFDRLLFQTCFRKLFCCVHPLKRHKRLKKLLGAADSQIKSALDGQYS